MNRNEEYARLLTELEEMPPALEYTVQRARARKKTLQKKRRIFGIPAGSLAACYLAFELLVNLFPPFALACGDIPLLRNLAKAVAWSPSLSAAVENEYVQPIEQEQSANGVTARVEYVIVDRKQFSVFYSLDTDAYGQLDADADFSIPNKTGSEGFGSSSGSYGTPNGELRQADVNFVEGDVPSAMDMTLRVYAVPGDEKAPPEPPESSASDEFLSGESVDSRGDTLAAFTFSLEFDPYYTARGETVSVNQAFTLDGQTVTVEEIEVYPTHLRVNLGYDGANTAWLKGLDLYLENENGEQFHQTTNGITATGDAAGTPAMTSFWLDSPYFSKGEHLTLHITGAEWLDKDKERVKIDLAHAAAEDLPGGVRLEWAKRFDTGWVVSFSAPYRWDNTTMYSIWNSSYFDAAGTEYDINSVSSTVTPYVLGSISGAELEAHEAYEKANQDRYFDTFGLLGYTEDEVWLEPCWTTVTQEKTPVEIVLK